MRAPRHAASSSAGALALLLLLAACGGASLRGLGCEHEEVARARQICSAVADNLKLSWGGAQGTLAPTYMLASRDLARVYCDLHLQPADAQILATMQRDTREPRLSQAARELHHLLVPSEAIEHTRYHPSHPRYVLRDGCPLLHRTRPR